MVSNKRFSPSGGVWRLLTVALGLSVLVPLSFGQTDTIAIARSDGTELRVPTKGPLADENALAVANIVRSFDAAIRDDNKQAGPVIYPPGTDISKQNAQVLAAMREMAIESRNQAVAQLDLAYRIANETSAGALDSSLVGSARRAISRAREIVGAPPPPSVFVRTEVTSAEADAGLHYVTMAEFRSNSNSWRSYDFGMPLHIGLYVFRMDGRKSGDAYNEEVLVLADPTQHKIVPLR